jgi:hypothetical protein
MFKLNFQYLHGCETFEYGFSQTAFQIQEPVHSGFRWVGCVLPMKSAEAAIMSTG